MSISIPRFPVGKLPAQELERLLTRLPDRDPRLLVRPSPGEDAAVIDMGDRCLIVTTDPITFAADRIGWYAVHVNANDVAVMGGDPRWFCAVILLPENGATPDLVRTIMADIERACEEIGAEVAGGHTEITGGLDRPIVVGQMLGEVDKAQLVRKARLAPGDQVLLTHGVAIEGAAILAREKAETLRGRVQDATRARAEHFLFDPGISVVKAARIAVRAGDVHSMHDPTEGGIVTGLVELAIGSHLGIHVIEQAIPVLPEAQAVCEALSVDPLRLIASGALLIGAAPSEARGIAGALEAEGIPAATVAEMRPLADGRTIEQDGAVSRLVAPERDEIARVFQE